MPYSPDMVPMERAINGNLKTNLKRRVARDRGQVVRAVRYEWSKKKILTIRRALKSWRTRVETMVKRDPQACCAVATYFHVTSDTAQFRINHCLNHSEVGVPATRKLIVFAQLRHAKASENGVSRKGLFMLQFAFSLGRCKDAKTLT